MAALRIQDGSTADLRWQHCGLNDGSTANSHIPPPPHLPPDYSNTLRQSQSPRNGISKTDGQIPPAADSQPVAKSPSQQFAQTGQHGMNAVSHPLQGIPENHQSPHRIPRRTRSMRTYPEPPESPRFRTVTTRCSADR